jgi:hypothetical protein
VSAVDELVRRLGEEGGLLAEALGAPRDDPERDGLAAVPERYGLAVEAIREGYLLHYGRGRLLDVDHDPDLALLAGDRLYALGLAALAELGDLAAVRAMADVIARAAAAHATQDDQAARRAWEAGMLALAADR